MQEESRGVQEECRGDRWKGVRKDTMRKNRHKVDWLERLGEERNDTRDVKGAK